MGKNPNRTTLLGKVLDLLRPLWNREPDFPADPYAYRMAPVRRGPKGRSGAAAVAEPDEDTGGFFRQRS